MIQISAATSSTGTMHKASLYSIGFSDLVAASAGSKGRFQIDASDASLIGCEDIDLVALAPMAPTASMIFLHTILHPLKLR